jgi:hypothetical protein
MRISEGLSVLHNTYDPVLRDQGSSTGVSYALFLGDPPRRRSITSALDGVDVACGGTRRVCDDRAGRRADEARRYVPVRAEKRLKVVLVAICLGKEEMR